MQNFKNKLYNYETPPPEKIWDNIIEDLYDERVIKMHRYRKNKFLFYGATAAASIIIIFIGSVFFKKNTNSVSTNRSQSDQLISQKLKDSIKLNQQILKSIINNPKEKKEIIAENPDQSNIVKKYLTVAGPEGQPVKISPKVATLIISTDDENPPKPVWSNEIRKWQQIMLSSTISPTSANFINLVQLAANKETIE